MSKPEQLNPHRKKAISTGIHTNLEMIKSIAQQSFGNDQHAEILTTCATQIEELVSLILGEHGQPETTATPSD